MIKEKILTIRGKQVILDRDLAELYEVETKRLNEQVKRNIDRFPEDFMFQLTQKDLQNLKSQFVTSSIKQILWSQNATSKSNYGGRRYLPYVFTEHGVTALLGVLKSKKAIEVNIKVIREFVSMRRFLSTNANIFNKFERIDQKLIEHDKTFEKVFDYMQDNLPKQGVFFDGQIFNAYKFICDLISKAKKRIILLDNYIDENTLYYFTKTKVPVRILSNNISKKLIEKYNSQYKNVSFEKFSKSHDRFLIIDSNVYLIGASLKDLGKKWFGFFKVKDIELILKKLSY